MMARLKQERKDVVGRGIILSKARQKEGLLLNPSEVSSLESVRFLRVHEGF